MPQATLLRAAPRRAVQHPLPDLDDEEPPAIRTPKRGPLRAAQVWDARGHWLVGLFPDRAAARAAAKRFLADPAAFPGAQWHKRRCDGHRPRYKWVRRVKGGAYQARVWLLAGRGSLNLGLFTTADHGDKAEWAAAQVSKAFYRLWCVPGRTVAEAVELLKREPKARDRCRPDLEVPAAVRDLTVPRDDGTEDADDRAERLRAERLERERRRYPATLLDCAA